LRVKRVAPLSWQVEHRAQQAALHDPAVLVVEHGGIATETRAHLVGLPDERRAHGSPAVHALEAAVVRHLDERHVHVHVERVAEQQDIAELLVVLRHQAVVDLEPGPDPARAPPTSPRSGSTRARGTAHRR